MCFSTSCSQLRPSEIVQPCLCLWYPEPISVPDLVPTRHWENSICSGRGRKQLWVVHNLGGDPKCGEWDAADVWWCDVSKQNGAHSIWAAFWGSTPHRIVGLYHVYPWLSSFNFFSSLSIVSLWNILGAGTWDRTQWPIFFCSSCDSTSRSLLFSLSWLQAQEGLPAWALKYATLRILWAGWCLLTLFFLIPLVLSLRSLRMSEQEFFRPKLWIRTILSISVFPCVEITIP